MKNAWRHNKADMSMRKKVVNFYQFVQLDNLVALQSELKNLLLRLNLKGTILLASEGINAMAAGTEADIDTFVQEVLERGLLDKIERAKFSHTYLEPFEKVKVRVKREIVTMGYTVDAPFITGHEVEPKDWNELISQNNVRLIDCRNDYEFDIGTFEGAENPETECFSEMLEYTDKHLAHDKGTKIAMFCTGGIRCEKYSSYLLSHGFEEVYQLKGGILKYLEEVSPEDSKWRGSCFIFDERIALNHKLEPEG